MKAKHVGFLLIILLLAISASGQERIWNKALGYYKQKNYDKAIEYAHKNIDHTQIKPGLYFILGLSNFQQGLQQQKPADRLVRIKKSVNYIYQGYRYDRDSSFQKQLARDLDIFRDSLYNFAQYYYKENDTRNARFFSQAIASIYHDTTDIYRDLFMPKPKPKEPSLKEKQMALVAKYSGPLNQTDALGRRQGMWIKKYPDGTIKYMIYFKDGHPAGTFKRFYPNGQLQVDMTYEITGHRAAAIFYDQDGHRIAMGYYYDQKRDSLWQFFVNDTIVLAEIYYKKGVKNGPERIYSYYYYPNLLRERYWKNGKQDSVDVEYYFDGTPKSFSHYKNGVLDGPFVLLDYNGKVKVKGQYKDGYMEGLWEYHNPNGTVDTVRYHLGEPVNPAMTEAESKILKAMGQAKGRYPEPTEMFKKQFGLEDW